MREKRTMQPPARLEPDITAKLSPYAVHDAHAPVVRRAALLEFAQDADNVARVANGRQGSAGELLWVVLEEARGARGDVEEDALEGNDVHEVVALLAEEGMDGRVSGRVGRGTKRNERCRAEAAGTAFVPRRFRARPSRPE